VNVFNTCYDKDWNVVANITGSAIAPNPCIPAALKVSFPNPPPPAPPLPESPPGPNYLIHTTDYVNYAIVGSPTRTSFFILSRKSKMCESEYKKWLKYAKSLGYNPSLIQQNYNAVVSGC
jgi:apolipoprotein D and lipocalin family protein